MSVSSLLFFTCYHRRHEIRSEASPFPILLCFSFYIGKWIILFVSGIYITQSFVLFFANLLWINLQCKFTTLPNDYKIAICLACIFNVFQTICIRLSVSVSQIIQNFKCKVNIKCYIFNNMQSYHILFLLSTSAVVQEHIIAVFSLVI